MGLNGGLPTGPDKARAVRAMFDRIAPRYDLVNRVMTFGMDAGWRRTSVAALGLARGSVVLDLACGTGDFCNDLRAAGYDALGFDLSFGMIAAATTKAPVVQGDILRLPLRDRFADGITCGFALRNVVDLESLFEECARVLRSGGRVALLDVAHPDAPLIRAGHHFYFHRVVPRIGALLSDRDAYRYLPESTAYLPETPALLEMLAAAEFEDARARQMGFGAVQLLTATRL
ncbi:MAG: ubiquinone/menaquinone biosynthesis methyltransferase [Actinomycetota bacterium]